MASKLREYNYLQNILTLNYYVAKINSFLDI